MKQLVLPKNYCGEDLFDLTPEDSHYLLKVQRKGIGLALDLIDTNGISYNGTIIAAENEICTLKLSPRSEKTIKEYNIYLFQCIPKGKKIDLMIRQSVETGVDKFYPIISDHSIPEYESTKEMEKKKERWEKIVKEAMQQSGSKNFMEIQPIMTITQALSSLSNLEYTGLFFHQVPMGNTSIHKTLENPKKNIIAVIGPEGGLSSKEVSILSANGFTPSLLGDNILRTETATIFALGAINIILLENKFWKIQ